MKIKVKIPTEYCEKAKDEIASIIKELEKDVAIKKLDASAILALAGYINNFYRAEAASFKLDDLTIYNADGSVRQSHPVVAQMDNAARGRDKLLHYLGLTPFSRSKMGKELEEEPNPFEKFSKT
jgi:P27 family predicted phage terminase small subunit